MTNNHLFSNLPFGSVGFHITSALPLQTLKGIGLHHITSHDYNWDNNTRKNSYLLLQYTLSGKGIFHISGKSYIQEANDLFLVQIPGDSQYALPSDSRNAFPFCTTFISPVVPLFTLMNPVPCQNK